MIKSETITAKIKNRILVTDAPIFSGEAVKIKLDFDCGDAVASNHKIVLFGVDKTALAEGTFSATESAWFADLDTATNEMAAYFADVPTDAAKTIGAMVVNTQTADVLTRGNVLVVSTPFPDDLAPCPQTYTYLTTEEFSSSMAAVETEIGGKANASDFIQLSSDVADLESAVATKAESSTVADLAEDMRSLVQSISDLDTNKADADIVADLAAEVDAVKGPCLIEPLIDGGGQRELEISPDNAGDAERIIFEVGARTDNDYTTQVIANIRDFEEASAVKVNLAFYCNGDGLYLPSNMFEIFMYRGEQTITVGPEDIAVANQYSPGLTDPLGNWIMGCAGKVLLATVTLYLSDAPHVTAQVTGLFSLEG
jgi:hypothetical protein